MERKSKMAAIFNKYKDTFDDLINSSDTKFSNLSECLNWPELIDKGLCNASKSRSFSPSFLKENCLDKDTLVMALERAPKTRDFQVYKRNDIASLSSKSGRV